MERHEYQEEISSLADDLVEEMQNHDRESWFDYVHETLDGHSFCIYTAESQDVVRHSNNDGAAVEDFGADCLVKDNQLNWGMMAYCALERDVLEEINRQGYDINDDDTFGPQMECSICKESFKEEDMMDDLCDECYDAQEESNA